MLGNTDLGDSQKMEASSAERSNIECPLFGTDILVGPTTNHASQHLLAKAQVSEFRIIDNDECYNRVVEVFELLQKSIVFI